MLKLNSFAVHLKLFLIWFTGTQKTQYWRQVNSWAQPGARKKTHNLGVFCQYKQTHTSYDFEHSPLQKQTQIRWPISWIPIINNQIIKVKLDAPKQKTLSSRENGHLKHHLDLLLGDTKDSHSRLIHSWAHYARTTTITFLVFVETITSRHIWIFSNLR